MELSPRESQFIAASNILIGVLVFIDMFVIADMFQTDLKLLVLINLIMTLIALYQYRIKRRVKMAKAAASKPSPSPPSPSQ